MSRLIYLALSLWVYTSSSIAASKECGIIEPGQDGIHEGTRYPTYTYTTDKGRAVIVRQDMRVNADGARRAYQLDNHGISYLCDGLTAGHGAGWITSKPCGSMTADAVKRAKVRNDELYFSDQGPRLCVFGFSVEGGKKGVSGCSGSVVGGGQPAAKAQLTSVPAPGGPLQYFISTTSLRNNTNDKTKKWIDSEQIPFIVIPGKWPHGKIISLGDYAYVYSPGELGIKQESLTGPRGSFAIVADTGPRGKFGEGSIALHQMLVFGKLHPAPAYQKTASGKPHPEHASIYHPYQDRKDGDIRAKGNIDKELWYILFSNSANKEVKEHSFQVGNDGAPGGNVYAEGTSAAEMLGGHDHIISCLKESPHFD